MHTVGLYPDALQASLTRQVIVVVNVPTNADAAASAVVLLGSNVGFASFGLPGNYTVSLLQSGGGYYSQGFSYSASTDAVNTLPSLAGYATTEAI